MPKKLQKVLQVTLACETCAQRNYTTSKTHKQVAERLEIKKFCPHCNSHTLHRETR